jgi:hypothetical protein
MDATVLFACGAFGVRLRESFYSFRNIISERQQTFKFSAFFPVQVL